MVDELAEKQRNAKRVTQQYDEQLIYLEQSIYQIQTQRDRELSRLGNRYRLLTDIKRATVGCVLGYSNYF